MSDKCEVIVFHFQKGGVGKTTCSVQIAATLAAQGLKVLLIDTDFQDNCRLFFDSLDKRTKPEAKGLDRVLCREGEVDDLIVSVAKDLDFLPAGSDMQRVIKTLETDNMGLFKLNHYFDPLRKIYDYIILDTGPGLNIVTLSALYFGDKIIIPVKIDSMSLQSIDSCLEYIGAMKEQMKMVNKSLEIQYFIPNFLDFRKPEMEYYLEQLLMEANKNKIQVLPPVRNNIHLERLPERHRTLTDYTPVSESKSVMTAVDSLKRDFDRIANVITGKKQVVTAWREFQAA